MKRLYLIGVVAFLGAGVLLGTAAVSTAVEYPWEQITSNSGQNWASFFSLEVTDLGGGDVKFQFNNNFDPADTDAGIVAQVYFDDRDTDPFLNLSTALFMDSDGDAWSSPASPANLPSGNNADFSADFSGEPDGSNQDGIEPGDNLMVTFTLQTGTFADLIDSIDNYILGDGAEFAVGMHVISLGASADSESFVVPLPGTGLLFGAGFVAFVTWRRRQEKNLF